MLACFNIYVYIYISPFRANILIERIIFVRVCVLVKFNDVTFILDVK